MKRSLKLFTAGAALLIGAPMYLTGCGSGHSAGGPFGVQHNPLKNYDINWQPPYNAQPQEQSTKMSVVQLDASNDTTFVQGVTNKLDVNVRFLFPDIKDDAGVRYQLRLADGPAKQLGASIVHVNGNQWQLQWTPANDTLSPDQNNALYNADIQFVLLSSSSANVQALMAGTTVDKSINITLAKSEDQPVIENAPTSLEINADQSPTIQFVVAAKGFVKPDDIQVDLINGPETLSIELPQLDGRFATSWPTRVKSLGIDSLGRTRFLYQIQFNGSQFADTMYKNLSQSPRWSSKLNSGKINQTEALFYIRARNAYNGQISADKQVDVHVNLDAQAGEPGLVAGDTRMLVKAGELNKVSFLIGTHNGRGQLALDSVEMNGAPTVNVVNNRADLVTSDKKISVSFKCSDTSLVNLNKQAGCRSGACIETCYAQVNVDCSQKSIRDPLVINARSVLGSSVKTSKLLIPIDVVGQSNSCLSNEVASVKKGAAK